MYHHAKSDSRDECAQKFPPTEAGVDGSDVSPGLPSITPTDDLPPYTNRGAQITIPTENRTLVDWVAFTIKTPDPKEALSIISLDSSLFVELPKGGNGYLKALSFGQIKVFYEGRPEMGCHVVMSGEGCRLYESQFSNSPWFPLFSSLKDHKANFTRLDIATDNIDRQLCLEKIRQAILNKEIRTRFNKAKEIKEHSLSRDGASLDEGHTISFGSRQSRLFIRFYDKAAQFSLPGHWTRAELELKTERANIAVEYLVSGKPIGLLFSGIINQNLALVESSEANISRCPVQDWWHEWLGTTEKIKLTTAKAIKYVEEVMHYYEKQHASNFAMLETHLGSERFKLFFNHLIMNGKKRMSNRHRQILAVSTLDVDNDTAEAMDFNERAALIEFDGGLSRNQAEALTLQLLP